jgi:glyoxylase-like metal-dependent hydrolase (beta-lactamase superfamily II)
LFCASCSSNLKETRPLTQNRELDSFKTVAAFPKAEDAVVLVAAEQFMAARRDYDGYLFFKKLSAAQPHRPLLLSLQGMLQARVADAVPLLSRVAWVDEAIGKLDRGAAGAPVLGRYLRGLVFAQLPSRFAKAGVAVADLEFSIRHRSEFPFDPERGIYAALANARRALGDEGGAQAALKRGGLAGTSGARVLGNLSVDPIRGFRFSEPRLVREAEGVYVAEGFDMSNIAFIVDASGIIAIDAGTTEPAARAALLELRKVTQAPIRYVIFTHAHWDHVGGFAALREPGSIVIADATFPTELERVRAFRRPFGWFFGTEKSSLTIVPDRIITQPETLELGAKRISIYPAPTGETQGNLWIRDDADGLLFVGDAFMPYVGAPFAGGEGSPEGYLAAIAEVRRISPRRLVHGHPPLTRYFTIEAMPGLEAALREVYALALDATRSARPLSDLLHDNLVPESLRSAPAAAQPFLVVRDNFIEQIYRSNAGRWAADGEGLNRFTKQEWGAALDLMAGGSAVRIAQAVDDLASRGDAPIAYEIVTAALAKHPDSVDLLGSRARVLMQLRERYQFINPFRFIVYSELGATPLAPVQPKP